MWNGTKHNWRQQFPLLMPWGFLAALCIPVVTTSKNLLWCLHPNAHSQAAEGKLRDRSLSFQERGVEEGEITGLDSLSGYLLSFLNPLSGATGWKTSGKQVPSPVPAVWHSYLGGTLYYQVRFTSEKLHQELLLRGGRCRITESQQHFWQTGSQRGLLWFFLALVVSITKKSSLGFWKIVGGNVT